MKLIVKNTRIIYGGQELFLYLTPALTRDAKVIVYSHNKNFISPSVRKVMNQSEKSECIAIQSFNEKSELKINDFSKINCISSKTLNSILIIKQSTSISVNDNIEAKSKLKKFCQYFEEDLATNEEEKKVYKCKSEATTAPSSCSDDPTPVGKGYENISNFTALISDLQTKFMQHVEKSRKEFKVKISDNLFDQYFNYLIIKIVDNKYVTGLIPSFIERDCMYDGFKNFNDIKVNVNKIKEDLMSATQTLSSDIGAKVLTITEYNKDFESKNSNAMCEIVYQILSKFTFNYYSKEYYRLTDLKVLTSKIKEQLKYYTISKKTPKLHSDLIKVYRPFPSRIVNVLRIENVIEYEDKNKLKFKDDCLDILNIQIRNKSTSASTLFSKYFDKSE